MRISDWSADVCSSDLSATIWLADMADFAEMNAVWDAWIADGAAPARATGEAKQIGRASCRERVCQYVSISVVAVSFTKKEIVHTLQQVTYIKLHNAYNTRPQIPLQKTVYNDIR